MNSIGRRKQKDKLFHAVLLCITSFAIVFLGILLYSLVQKGLHWLDWQFLTSFPSRFAQKAGILPGLLGSLYLILLTILFTLPIGIGTALYLEEYASKNRFTNFIKMNISNLAGTPSIVYGLLGLTVFVRTFMLGKSIVAGALTLTLVILPIVIVAAQEAIKSVPVHLRHASFAIGATCWQTIFKVVLPCALPGILTGVILAISRALGESAPLIMVGAATYITFLPNGIFSGYTAMPMQIYHWIGLPKEDFKGIAAAGILVLMSMVIAVNILAIIIRNKHQKQI